MAKQTAKDRFERLKDGCCPIHGIGMSQIGLEGEGAEQRFLVGCPRKDCEIKGTSVEPFGPVELRPEYATLIGPRAI